MHKHCFMWLFLIVHKTIHTAVTHRHFLKKTQNIKNLLAIKISEKKVRMEVG